MGIFRLKEIFILLTCILLNVTCGPSNDVGTKDTTAPYVDSADVKKLYSPTYDLYNSAKSVYVSLRNLSNNVNDNTYMLSTCRFSNSEMTSVQNITSSLTSDGVDKMAKLVSDTNNNFVYTSNSGIPVLLNTIIYDAQIYNPDIRILNMRKQQIRNDLNYVNQTILDAINNINTMISNPNGKSVFLDGDNGLRVIYNKLTAAINNYKNY